VVSPPEPVPSDRPKITASRHPSYTFHYPLWREWRLTYKAGRRFIDEYLERFSIRESDPDFDRRKKVTPIPAFAKAAVNDIKNSIFQRMVDTTREDGPPNYQAAVEGNDGGIDRRGGTMNWFIGDQILPELLTMKKVGVFIDSPPLREYETAASRTAVHPYLYRYCAEDILNWAWKTDSYQLELQAVLLRDTVDVVDSNTKLPTACVERFRLMWIGDNGKVHVQFYDKDDKKIGSEIILNITKIPFVIFEISESLLMDAASYQIALLNLKSTDIAFALKSNFPFYTEQRDLQANDLFKQHPNIPQDTLIPSPNDPTSLTHYDPTAACYSAPARTNGSEILVGTAQGRAYPKGAERPGFINPSTDPLKASMDLQSDLKEEIRLLINLALSNVKPQMASAESKAMDQAGLESGLSYIGLELEHGERQIGIIWAEYEQDKPPTIKYPERYSLKTDDQQQKEATDLKSQLFTAASTTYQKEIVKRIAIILLGTKVSSEKLAQILEEIDNAPASTADPDVLTIHLENQLIGIKTASTISGYNPSESDQATKDHEARLARIALSQTKGAGAGAIDNPAARGIPDLSATPNKDAKDEKKQ